MNRRWSSGGRYFKSHTYALHADADHSDYDSLLFTGIYFAANQSRSAAADRNTNDHQHRHGYPQHHAHTISNPNGKHNPHSDEHASPNLNRYTYLDANYHRYPNADTDAN